MDRLEQLDLPRGGLPAPAPKSLLGRHRVLSPSASIKVSPLCLGGMNFGDRWKFMGSNSKEQVFKVLDEFYAAGGNFIDTANAYQDEQSELWIGEWMAARGVRDQMVIATKYTSNYQTHHGKYDSEVYSNYGGNNVKSLKLSLEASLKKLQTSYVDIFYIHWWDYATSVEEVMHALNDVVARGQVLYLGASDLPAWVVSKANQYARDHSLRPFVVYQGEWSAAKRDFEREILQMVRVEGMGLAPWGALGSGHFKTRAQREAKEGARMLPGTQNHALISDALERIAEKKGCTLHSIALAYILQKQPYTFPIIGCRKIEHLRGNIEALALELTKDDIKEIEEAADFDLGFPNGFLNPVKNTDMNASNIWMMKASGVFDYVEHEKPIVIRH